MDRVEKDAKWQSRCRLGEFESVISLASCYSMLHLCVKSLRNQGLQYLFYQEPIEYALLIQCYLFPRCKLQGKRSAFTFQAT